MPKGRHFGTGPKRCAREFHGFKDGDKVEITNEQFALNVHSLAEALQPYVYGVRCT
ncbi:hypothetical protein JMJ77_0004323, partial [Colletotrichum scovillei]